MFVRHCLTKLALVPFEHRIGIRTISEIRSFGIRLTPLLGLQLADHRRSQCRDNLAHLSIAKIGSFEAYVFLWKRVLIKSNRELRMEGVARFSIHALVA